VSGPPPLPLSGRTVVVTRDGDPDDPLVTALRDRGATVLVWPTLAFEPPLDPTPLEAALRSPDAWDWIVFTSARAVAAVLAHAPAPAGHAEAADVAAATAIGGATGDEDDVAVAQYPYQATTRVAAVGDATARALAAAGWRVDVVGRGPGAVALAATLSAAADLAGARVLFPAASRAADGLASALAEAGAHVHRVDAYRTVARGPDPALVRRDLAAGVDVLTFASPSAVEALAASLDALPGRNTAGPTAGLAGALAGCAVAAIGPTTAEALTRRGVADVTVADTASLEGLVQAVQHMLSFDPTATHA
jgi:uroporphyrinogen-III synthase